MHVTSSRSRIVQTTMKGNNNFNQRHLHSLAPWVGLLPKKLAHLPVETWESAVVSKVIFPARSSKPCKRFKIRKDWSVKKDCSLPNRPKGKAWPTGRTLKWSMEKKKRVIRTFQPLLSRRIRIPSKRTKFHSTWLLFPNNSSHHLLLRRRKAIASGKHSWVWVTSTILSVDKRALSQLKDRSPTRCKDKFRWPLSRESQIWLYQNRSDHKRDLTLEWLGSSSKYNAWVNFHSVYHNLSWLSHQIWHIGHQQLHLPLSSCLTRESYNNSHKFRCKDHLLLFHLSTSKVINNNNGRPQWDLIRNQWSTN